MYEAGLLPMHDKVAAAKLSILAEKQTSVHVVLHMLACIVRIFVRRRTCILTASKSPCKSKAMCMNGKELLAPLAYGGE